MISVWLPGNVTWLSLLQEAARKEGRELWRLAEQRYRSSIIAPLRGLVEQAAESLHHLSFISDVVGFLMTFQGL